MEFAQSLMECLLPLDFGKKYERITLKSISMLKNKERSNMNITSHLIDEISHW